MKWIGYWGKPPLREAVVWYGSSSWTFPVYTWFGWVVMAAVFALVTFGIFSAARGSRGRCAGQHAAWENEAPVDPREYFDRGAIGRTEFEQAKRELSQKAPRAA